MWDDIKGCIGLVLGILVLYALVNGVTVRGKHYGVRDCNSEHGIVFDAGEPVDAGAGSP